MATIATETRGPVAGISTGSMAEILGGVAAIVLSIVGLAQTASIFMMSVVTILLGVTMLFEGAGIAADYTRTLAKARPGVMPTGEAGGGMTTEILAGIAGIALGILALLGLFPTTLVPAAIIVFGAAMIFNTSAISELNELKAEVETAGEGEVSRRAARGPISAAISSDTMIGVAAVVLGILAVVNVAPVTLSLVALLSLGAAELLIGTAVGGRLLALLTP
jgi:hypothetical protein